MRSQGLGQFASIVEIDPRQSTGMVEQGARRASHFILTIRSQAMIHFDTDFLIRAVVRNSPQNIKSMFRSRSRPGAGFFRGLLAMSVLS